MNLCKCGCGQNTNFYRGIWRTVIHGHNARINPPNPKKTKSIPKLCECGCNQYAKAKRRFINGHFGRGKNNPMFGRTGKLAPMFGKIGNLHPNFGKKRPDVSERNRQNSGEKSHMFGRTGEKNPRFGKPGFLLGIIGNKHPCFGKKFPNVSKLMKQRTREKNYAWKGGISFEPYSLEWNTNLKKQIRENDHYTCQLCKKCGKDVHHIDYNKKNCNPTNLITLCHRCNSLANANRDQYEIGFKIYKTGSQRIE